MSDVDDVPAPELKPGARLSSAVCTTQVVVVKAPPGVGPLECGGVPMVPHDVAAGAAARPRTGFDGSTQLGKRYRSSDGSLVVLCVKAGAGTLSVAGTPLEMAEAARLPASD